MTIDPMNISSTENLKNKILEKRPSLRKNSLSFNEKSEIEESPLKK
jgi:hypothetical protein